MKRVFPYVRARLRSKKLYEQYQSGFQEAESEFLEDSDFFKGYEEVIEVSDALPSAGMLTICPTPIGNLKDISLRQYTALRTGDILACEDTRVTGLLINLLSTYNLADPGEVEFPPKDLGQSPEFDEYTYGLTSDFIAHTVQCIKDTREKKGRGLMVSLNAFNQAGRTPKLVKAMKSGLNVVLVADAGMPLVSDPGYCLVKAAVQAGVSVDALPGGVAAITALVSSGFPADNFYFQGFLPKNASDKRAKLQKMKEANCTAIVYESSHRVFATLEAIQAVYGKQHQMFVGKELTKLHQRMYRGSAAKVLTDLEQESETTQRLYGEITLVLAPSTVVKDSDLVEISSQKLFQSLHRHVKATPRNLKILIEKITGWPRNKISQGLKAAQEADEISEEEDDD